jgi:hypothetical protein
MIFISGIRTAEQSCYQNAGIVTGPNIRDKAFFFSTRTKSVQKERLNFRYLFLVTCDVNTYPFESFLVVLFRGSFLKAAL